MTNPIYTKAEAIALAMMDGRELRYLLTEWKHDKDVVLAAVTENGNSLQYAGDELKNDKEVVLAAVTKNGRALGYASDLLQKDPVLQFIAEHREFISNTDWPIVFKALLEDPEYFLNPEPYVLVLTEGIENPYLILAQYALGKDVIIESEQLPIIEF